jgi:hypothetical protein
VVWALLGGVVVSVGIGIDVYFFVQVMKRVTGAGKSPVPFLALPFYCGGGWLALYQQLTFGKILVGSLVACVVLELILPFLLAFLRVALIGCGRGKFSLYVETEETNAGSSSRDAL